MLKLSHLYLVDHVVQTLFTVGFARHYWYEVPHDGRRVVNSQAQEDLIRLAVSRGEVSDKMPDNIAEIAKGLWEKEEGFARIVLVLAWLIKVGLRAKSVRKRRANSCETARSTSSWFYTRMQHTCDQTPTTLYRSPPRARTQTVSPPKISTPRPRPLSRHIPPTRARSMPGRQGNA